jgi:hypothetical protein
MEVAMSRLKLLSGSLGLLVVLGLGLAALWLAGGVPFGSTPRPFELPPDARVKIEMDSIYPPMPANSVPVVHIGEVEIEMMYGRAVDGITYDSNGLMISAAQFARLEGHWSPRPMSATNGSTGHGIAVASSARKMASSYCAWKKTCR